MLAYVFPGQGSQSIGMGKELFPLYPELVHKADEILGYSIVDLCLNGSEETLKNTAYTQPALYIVNALMYLDTIEKTGLVPNYLAGHSLGEYNALFAAGAFSFEDGLRLVKKRGELMNKATGGGMAAVLQVSSDRVKEIMEKHNLVTLDVGNYNSPIQTVISGKEHDIINAKQIFESEGVKRYVILKVGGAFHSRYMRSVAEEFGQYIEKFSFQKMNIPVISNLNARPYKIGDERKNLVEQIYHSVQWTDTIRYLMGRGDIEIKQIGPGTVLTGLTRIITSKCEPITVKEEVVEEKAMDSVGNCNDFSILPEHLGSKEFKDEYGLKYAYLAGGMYKGISSKEMVVSMANEGMMAFLGTGGMSLNQIEEDICYIQNNIKQGMPYGVNFIHNPSRPQMEEAIIDICLKYGVSVIESSAFMYMTPSIVKYRLKGLYRDTDGIVKSRNRIIAKLSRPEVAEIFMDTPPKKIVDKLYAEGKVSKEQVEMSKEIAMADAITAEADSGGHTDGAVALALLPAMIQLRNRTVKNKGYKKTIRIGVAGGIGTPESAAAAFIMGADYVVTGSVNQCTVEAATSDIVKDMLQEIDVQDTDYVPAGDMFEMGAKAQVLKRGVFFPARGNRLYELYKQYNSLEEIPEKTRTQLEKRYFKHTFDEILQLVKEHYSKEEIDKAEQNGKYKMSLIFKWYFAYSTRVALEGDEKAKVDFQVPCGPALGAFNQWVKGTELEDWHNRHVCDIGSKIMKETANILNARLREIKG